MADHNFRVRLAPSPTGDVHLGSIWIALFDWILARQNNGTFVLRIEDTDQHRLVPGSIEKIYEALDWYGLAPDEGPKQGGPYAPYVQSERLPLYQQTAKQLVSQGHAYHCFCTPERLEALRTAQQAAKQAPRYDKHCLRLPAEEVQTRLVAGERSVIRLNMPATGQIELSDSIHGLITFQFEVIDDSVLLKSDGFPTYHLAVVVDDHAMAITHVIRGEEWVSSAPKHLYLYQVLGWTPPQFAHLPLILGPDKKKLSKRHGAASAISFRDEGFLPEAMINFLALMGWHPKGESEILSRQDVLEQFRLDDINPSGAVFDRTKLEWLNGWYIRQLPVTELVDRLTPFWHIPGPVQPDGEWKQRAARLAQERLRTLAEINEAANFLWPAVWDTEHAAFDRQLLIPKKGTIETAADGLAWIIEQLSAYPGDWTAMALKTFTLEAISTAGRKNTDVLWPTRVALSLRAASPDVFDMMDVLGREETIRRLVAVQKI